MSMQNVPDLYFFAALFYLMHKFIDLFYTTLPMIWQSFSPGFKAMVRVRNPWLLLLELNTEGPSGGAPFQGQTDGPGRFSVYIKSCVSLAKAKSW